MARLDPPPPTAEEVEQAVALIVEENPDRAAIEKTDRETLRRRPRRGPGFGPQGGSPEREPAAAGWSGRQLPTRDPELAARHPDAAGGQPSAPSRRPGNSGESRTLPPHNGADRAGAVRVPLAADEEQWVVDRTRQHLEQQAAQPRAANYAVERAGYGYRITVQYLEVDEQGQATQAGETSTLRLSRQGHVLEMTNGSQARSQSRPDSRF